MISIFMKLLLLLGRDWYTVIKLLKPYYRKAAGFFSSPNMHLALYRFFVIVSQVTIILL